ncbi:MAG: hypothetical protein GX591_00625, partial [Planctomycetes bacterium]|nr:hypothetical protein [Planctomycetota bacterium]
IEDAGLTVETFADITARVRPTWTHVQRLIRRPLVRWLVRHADEATRAFVDACQAMGPAYDEGIMAYGMITAHRPPRHD